MQNSRYNEVLSKNKKDKKSFSKITSFLILGAVIIALVGIGTLFFSESSKTVEASMAKQDKKKKFKATKKIIVDKQTGQVRKPNKKEIEELVNSLEPMTRRSDEKLETTSLPNGGEAMNLENSFGGTMLARPNSDGTMEVRCVFTFDEATEFLGLVEDNTQQ